MKLKCKE